MEKVGVYHQAMPPTNVSRFALVFNATLFVNHIDFCLALRIIWLVFLQNQFCLYFSFRNNKIVYGEFIFS